MHPRWIAGGALSLALLTAALGGAPAPATEAQSTAMVRAVHMAPGAPNVDVAVDGRRAFANLAFKAATEYAPVPAGQRNVKVTPAGATEPVVIDANLIPQPGQQITVVATGELPNLSPLVLVDNNSVPPAGQAKVRFVHAAPDAPAVDIVAQGGPTLFRNIPFRGTGDYVNVPAGTYTLEVRPAGQTSAVLTVPNVSLTPGQIVTVFAAGKVSDNSLAAVPIAYQPMPSTMARAGAGVAADPRPGMWLALLGLVVASGAVVGLRLAARRAVR